MMIMMMVMIESAWGTKEGSTAACDDSLLEQLREVVHAGQRWQ